VPHRSHGLTVFCHRTGIRYPHVGGKRSTSQFHYIATPMVAGGEVVPEQIAVRWSSLSLSRGSPYLCLSQPGHRHQLTRAPTAR